MNAALLALWAAPVGVGFAVFFNVRRRALVGVAVMAVIGRMVRDVLISFDLTTTVASFVAALTIGMLAYTIGPMVREASPVYSFAPIIPLVPGALIFTTLTSMVDSLTASDDALSAGEVLAADVSTGIEAAAIMLALAVGTTSPALLLRRRIPLGSPSG